DKSTSVEKLLPDKKLRCSEVILEPGGGGINVSKAIRKLGGDSLAVFSSGGNNGKLLEELLVRDGIRFRAIPVQHETRENFTAVDRAANAQYRFVMPGGDLSEQEMGEFVAVFRALDPAPEIIVASGSLPEGAPEDLYARLARAAREKGVRLIVDTSGTALLKAAEEGLFLLKPNLSELCSLVGKDFLELDEIDDAARTVLGSGKCEVLIVSRGPAGALLVTRDLHESIPAPTVRKLSTVGAGDSMVGGMVYQLARGANLKEMARFGVACGTAATMNPGTRLFNEPDVRRLYDWIRNHSGT
ncbi:MAG TPA: 1-phosphofructokinase family hexose kinase, partial [Sphingobacteriaceae bacterium]